MTNSLSSFLTQASSPLTSAAKISYLWSRTRWFREIEDLLSVVQSWRDVSVRSDESGLRFHAGCQTLGRLRWNGRLDVNLPAELRSRLLEDGLAARNPDEPRARGVVWIIRTPADVERALWLLRLAYLLTRDDRRRDVDPVEA